MKRYWYRNNWFTVNELSELSGIAAPTIRDRIRRGYSIAESMKLEPTHDSIICFNEASWWEDWIGQSIADLHKTYWTWCVNTGFEPIGVQGFSRQLMRMYPNLKIVPIKRGNKCYRIIRRV